MFFLFKLYSQLFFNLSKYDSIFYYFLESVNFQNWNFAGILFFSLHEIDIFKNFHVNLTLVLDETFLLIFLCAFILHIWSCKWRYFDVDIIQDILNISISIHFFCKFSKYSKIHQKHSAASDPMKVVG